MTTAATRTRMPNVVLGRTMVVYAAASMRFVVMGGVAPRARLVMPSSGIAIFRGGI